MFLCYHTVVNILMTTLWHGIGWMKKKWLINLMLANFIFFMFYQLILSLDLHANSSLWFLSDPRPDKVSCAADRVSNYVQGFPFERGYLLLWHQSWESMDFLGNVEATDSRYQPHWFKDIYLFIFLSFQDNCLP